MLLLYPIVSSGNKVCKAVEVLKEHQVMMKMMTMIMLKMMMVMVFSVAVNMLKMMLMMIMMKTMMVMVISVAVKVMVVRMLVMITIHRGNAETASLFSHLEFATIYAQILSSK